MVGEIPPLFYNFLIMFIVGIAFLIICFILPITIMRILLKLKKGVD